MKKTVAIVGGGTAGLFLAAFLNTDGYAVTIYEKKAGLGRKFLVAGDGGFNLTHAEELSQLKGRYTPSTFLTKALDEFSNADLRAWLLALSIPTFIGSSGRVFPEKGIRPIDVLKCIEKHLIDKPINFEFNKTFIGWNDENALIFEGDEIITADYTVFALGGSSWKVTGSDGSWLHEFSTKGISTVPFQPSNCAYQIDWDEKFIKKQEGKPLKNISVTVNNQTQKGEVVITRFGLEGNAIYGLSPQIKTLLTANSEAIVYIDFKPTISLSTLIKRITDSKLNTTTILREAVKLSTAAVHLIKCTLSKEEFLDVDTLARFIKNFPLKITGSAPIDEAISTSGGIGLSAVNTNFELKKVKSHFCIGEMLDWDAPTGGYLIQGCASMGVCLARQLNNK